MKVSLEEALREVKSRLDIVSIISRTVNLKKTGTSYVGLCPFHNDKSPSMHVSQQKGIYKCFSCGASGDTIKFLTDSKKITFFQAVSELASEIGLEIMTRENRQEETEEAQVVFKMNQLAKDFYLKHLFESQEGREHLRYLLVERKLREDTIRNFALGSSPSARNGLLIYIQSSDFGLGDYAKDPNMLLKSGLFIENKQGPGFIDRFRGRLMVPILDLSSRVIAFGARAMKEDQGPKYLNSPETIIYQKGHHLYGANIAFEKTKSARQVLVLEGYFDVIQAHQEGFEFAVGTLGTALSKEQARLLYQSNLQRRVVLGFDNDDAGFRALKSSLAVFQEASFGQRCDLRVFDLHETKDIDDLLKFESGPKKVSELLDSSPEAFSHVIQKYYEQCDLTEAISREHYVNEAVEIVAKVYDPIQRELLAEICAEKFLFTKETIIDLLNKRKVPTKTIFKETKSSSKGSITNTLEYLILALLSFSDDSKVQKEISEINFQTEELNLMKHELLSLSLNERERALTEITVIQKQINIIKARLNKGENFETIFKECMEQLIKVNSNSPKKFTAIWKKKETQLGIKPIN